MTKASLPLPVDGDALLCALVLVPRSFSRNRYFGLFEHPEARRIRRRAARIRGLIRQLSTDTAEVIGEQILEDDRLLLRYRVPHLAFERTTALAPLEASTLRFALHRAGRAPLAGRDRVRVETALASLSAALNLPAIRP